MTPEIPATFLSPLLHAAALLLFPGMMGLSTTMCVASSPSPYSIVAVHEYVSRTRTLDRLWLFVAVAWMPVAFAQGAKLSVSSSSAIALTVGTAVAIAGMVAANRWLHTTLGPELAAAAAKVSEGGVVTREDTNGTIVALRREREPAGEPPLASAVGGVRLYAIVTAVAVVVFAAVSVALGAASSAARLMQCLLVAGFYSSLGVFFVDLIQDVWPGFTTKRRLARASRYYVQIFEQWVNYGVLISFLAVLIGAPLAWMRGYAPAAVISFPVWILGCLCFATFFNQVLNRYGIVESRLPLPVYVNEYSATRALWAHFFTVIHVVMAAGLFAGLVAVSATIG